MKGAVAAFMCAIQTYLSQQKKGERLKGRLTLLLTTDEEGDGHDGIRRVVPWLEARNALPDFCLVGEPTSVHQTGDTIKIGRRGSLLSELVCYGKSGHIAYPHLADNPIPRLTKTLYCLKEHPLDRGDDMFQPSNLEVTSLYTKNAASNVIPGMVSARFGIRFNPHQTIEGLEDWIRGVSKAHAGQHQLSFHRSGEPYLTTDSAWIKRVEGAVQSVTGDMPERSTSGGTSDGRFLGARCPVVELGLTNKTIHQIDECVLVKDLYLLQRMYEQFLAMTFV
jgi:succinyl-diaminopimelate desuccinylase